MTGEQALEVQTLFRGVVIGTKYVVAPTRRRPLSRARARASTFVIGASARADAPVAAAFLRHLGEDSAGGHTLIGGVSDGDDVDTSAIMLAPGMTGTIHDGERTRHVRSPADGETPGPRVVLPRGGRAQLTCGEVTFLVADTERPPAVGAARFSWREAEIRYHLAAALGVALLLCMLLAVPGDPRALALDLITSDRGLVRFLIKPPMPIEDEEPGAGAIAEPHGAPALAARGPAGAPGNERAREPVASAPHRSSAAALQPRPSAARAPIDARQAGVLGVFQQVLDDSPEAKEVLAAGSALGKDRDRVLNALVAGPGGTPYGHGGLDHVGTGDGGGGTGEHTLGGDPRLGTIGIAGGGGEGPSYGGGPGVGRLGPHRVRTIGFIDGSANVRGSLDREIVRRIIRRHINEVKFCYEQELIRHAGLSGRMVVQFTIAQRGQVLVSFVESSTLGNARVENCTVQAVHRWEFPRPEGGGLVTVSYPFVLTPAAGGGE